METNLFAFADHREFLKAYLSERGPSQGVRALARKAGFKSPGYLTMLVKGDRKLTPRSAEMLARALALKGSSRQLLIAFARLDSCRSEKEKQQAQSEILRIKSRRPEFRINAKQYSFLATWYCPVIYALLSEEGANPTSAQFAAYLGRGVSVAMVEKALSDLEFLGLIERDTAGEWRQVHKALATPEDIREIAVQQYHRNNLELAEAALSLPPEEREFGGLTVAVPRRLLPKVKDKIRALRSELNEMLSAEKSAADVYQISINLFPLTKGIERIEQ